MKWAYIFEHPGTHPTDDRTTIELGGVTSLMVPVPDAASAPQVAVGLAGEGVRLIELCGGFTSADAAAVAEAVGDAVAVGHVMFSIESLTSAAKYSSDFAAEFETDQAP
jgi:hypothetical protein